MKLRPKWTTLLPLLIEAATRDTASDARHIARSQLLMLAQAVDNMNAKGFKPEPVDTDNPAYQMGYEHGFSGEPSKCPEKFTDAQRQLYYLAFDQGVEDYVDNIWSDK